VFALGHWHGVSFIVFLCLLLCGFVVVVVVTTAGFIASFELFRSAFVRSVLRYCCDLSKFEKKKEKKRKKATTGSSPGFVPGDDLIWSFAAAASC
jgi:hypothetical protein